MDSRQFETMVRAYSSDLYRFALWLCRNRWQAQDLVQECFAAAWTSREALRNEGATKAWLFSILRNKHASIYQRKQLTTEAVELKDLGDTAAASGYERVELEQCLRTLPQPYREPLLLQVLGGFSGKEIARMMGITEQNVMTRLCRARQALRRLASAGGNSDLEGVKIWNA
jgi:RNA polymerase sigma-70 factor (ECF subfamily)